MNKSGSNSADKFDRDNWSGQLTISWAMDGKLNTPPKSALVGNLMNCEIRYLARLTIWQEKICCLDPHEGYKEKPQNPLLIIAPPIFYPSVYIY
ncbi:hypothetical protein AVEN_109618-1 [Araneus ventricosus]|uniref:Uncharacterized protein n=1 Tax=Araneus ventricosus TaxID=182803 RepID=A0A4Y2TDX5_ARAVE|nr:hypothetical protein AVEN_109618-1 [Araneus ventricosus]